MGMIIVFTGFASLFNELGLGAAVIQKQQLSSQDLSSIFWTNLFAGSCLTIIFLIAAPWLAAFYMEPMLQSLTIAIAPTFLVGALTIVQRNLLKREMNFRYLFFVDTLTAFIAGIFAAIFAIKGWGVWSLVIQSLSAVSLSAVLLWGFSPWRPQFYFARESLHSIFGFSSNLMGFNILNYWNRNLDNLLVGRFLGSESLGIYSRAYSLMMLPITQVTSIFTQVMFPALSAIQTDKVKVKRVYLRATRMIALASFPLMLWLLVTARPFILFLYGSNWESMVPIFQILSMAGLFQSIGTTVGWIYNSQGRTDILLRWGLYTFIIRVSAFVIGLRWGVMGVALAYLISGHLFLTGPSWIVAGRLIDMSFSKMVTNILPALLCAIGMAIVVFSLGLLIPSQWSYVAQLGTQLMVGVATYFALIHLFQIRAYTEARFLLSEQWGLHRQSVPKVSQQI